MKLREITEEIRNKLFPGPSYGLDKCFEPAQRILNMYTRDGGIVATPYHINCGNCEHFDSTASKIHGDPCRKK